MGRLSDRYDTCTQVKDKREVARLVVEAVYENGGRFLDAEGNDIGYKRSMDKAMKALKDRRHIKGRKSGQAKREEKEKRGEADDSGAVASPPPPPKKSSLKVPKKVRDPLTTDDAGHALLLL